MSQDRISMPSSGAGITQYFNETKSRISISPQMVLGISILIVVVVIILNSL
ncbi:MAG: preprotein translocase subunit Sec61beta [Candidatus Woesearchaeota archaeon]